MSGATHPMTQCHIPEDLDLGGHCDKIRYLISGNCLLLNFCPSKLHNMLSVYVFSTVRYFE